jgi:hypothetical protein
MSKVGNCQKKDEDAEQKRKLRTGQINAKTSDGGWVKVVTPMKVRNESTEVGTQMPSPEKACGQYTSDVKPAGGTVEASR